MKNNVNQAPSHKVQKVLAELGYASRRTIEQWIVAGRIRINARRASLGDRVTATDKLYIDNKLASHSKSPTVPRILIYNKPEGEVCTRYDEADRPTVFQNLPKLKRSRWISVGRLDINTSGLLLFTTDGTLAHKLMHPSFDHEREYAVRVYGQVTTEMLNNLKKGVFIDDKQSYFKDIQDLGGDGRNHWYSVILTAGRYRLVRKLWESQNVTVSRLIRIRFAHIKLPRKLKAGHYQEISPNIFNRET